MEYRYKKTLDPRYTTPLARPDLDAAVPPRSATRFPLVYAFGDAGIAALDAGGRRLDDAFLDAYGASVAGYPVEAGDAGFVACCYAAGDGG